MNLYLNLEVLFLYNSWLFYSFLSYRMGSAFDEGIHTILKDVQKHDLNIIEGFNDNIEGNEMLIKWEEDTSDALAVSDELTIAQVAVFNSIEGHAFRDTVASKLVALVTLEMAAQQSIRMRMVNSVKSEVKNHFLTSKTAKENAMNHAIAVLTAGPKATMGKDVVGEAYNIAVKNYQANYAKQPAGTDDILLALERDVAAIAVPITFEATGGNVYVTNPIRA